MGRIPGHFVSYRPIALLRSRTTYQPSYCKIVSEKREMTEQRTFNMDIDKLQVQQNLSSCQKGSRTSRKTWATTIFFLALEYSMAFHSIPHQKLLACLHRMGTPSEIRSLVKGPVRRHKIQDKDSRGISDEYKPEIRVRQGCPLSLYLYIIATSCLMMNLLKDYEQGNVTLPTGATHPTLLFADDALLLTKAAAQMDKLLALVLEHSIP